MATEGYGHHRGSPVARGNSSGERQYNVGLEQLFPGERTFRMAEQHHTGLIAKRAEIVRCPLIAVDK